MDNHHIGFGGVREVDIFKGVNVSWRMDAIQAGSLILFGVGEHTTMRWATRLELPTALKDTVVRLFKLSRT